MVMYWVLFLYKKEYKIIVLFMFIVRKCSRTHTKEEIKNVALNEDVCELF